MGNASRIGGVCFEECSEIESAKGDCAARLSIHVLASGSGGNASVIVDGATGKAIVIDCGICKRDFFPDARRRAFPCEHEGILITHEHTDHTKGLGVALRGMAKLGLEPAVFVSEGVREVPRSVHSMLWPIFAPIPMPTLSRLAACWFIRLRLRTIRSSLYGFRIEVRWRCSGIHDRYGYCDRCRSLRSPEAVRILAIESNHDEKLLAEGPYPYVVKRRIASDAGHLKRPIGRRARRIALRRA